MSLHFLSGDSLVKPFLETGIKGEFLVCRECLIDGDLKSESLADFWEKRENYLGRNSQKDRDFYKNKVKSDFESLKKNKFGGEINLWFEYELFCQVNYWFCLYLLKNLNKEIYVVYPHLEKEKDIWKGFAFLDKEGLKRSFSGRVKLSEDDILRGALLWKAFSNKNFEDLKNLSRKNSRAFPSLKEIGRAASEVETEPKRLIKNLIEKKGQDFGKVFQNFNKDYPIYGFGDLQVKKIYDEIIN